MPSVETSVHLVAATIQFEQGDYAAARQTNSRVLALSEEHGMVQFVIMAHLRLAGVGCAVGDADGAAAHLDSAKALIPTSLAAGIPGSSARGQISPSSVVTTPRHYDWPSRRLHSPIRSTSPNSAQRSSPSATRSS